MIRMRPGWRLVVAFGVALLGGPLALPSEARAENPIEVGTQLVATSDVTLHRAEISKGSKVSVTKILTREGRTDGFAVALADGHIVKVTLSTIRSFFRIAE
jgi:hypothetical protein